jgi:hypothetical protein
MNFLVKIVSLQTLDRLEYLLLTVKKSEDAQSSGSEINAVAA